jgi:ribosome maturation factor RimP
MMYGDSLLPTLEPLAARAAEAEGVRVAWLELKRRGGSWLFRVFIEREDGDVGLADCERVGQRLSVALDVEDPIDTAYTLEVSTPGLDRPLHDEKDYRRFAGRLARITTRRALQGRRRFSGRLAGVEEGVVLLDEPSGEQTRLPLAEIEKGRLEVELDVPRRPGRDGRSS